MALRQQAVGLFTCKAKGDFVIHKKKKRQRPGGGGHCRPIFANTEGGGSASAVSQQNPGGGGPVAVFSITREEVDDRNLEEIDSIWEEVDAADLLVA